MDPLNEAVRIVVQQGGWAVIAVLIFYAYRKDVKGTADVLIAIVKEDIASRTELASLVRALHNRLDPGEFAGRIMQRKE